MKPKDWLLELSMPAAMAALGIYVLNASQKIKPKSAGVFPRLCAWVMLIGVVITVIQIIISKKKTTHFEGKKWWKALLLLAMIGLYIFLLPKIGYLIPTIALCASVMVLLQYRNWTVVSLVSVIAVAVIFVLFKIILKVPLPMLFLNI